MDEMIRMLSEVDDADSKRMLLPTIHFVKGCDTFEDKDGNKRFGAYSPRGKQIFIPGDAPSERICKALFHGLCHWAQDISDGDFDEDEAKRFSESIYDALLSTLPIGEAYLTDWYINSVDDSEPVWTESHIEELMNDFYLIPKEVGNDG